MPKNTKKNAVPDSVSDIRFDDFLYAKEVREAAKVFKRSSIEPRNGWGFKLFLLKNYRKTGNSRIWEFVHFEIDETGLVVRAPDNIARNFVHKVRIVWISSILSEFKKRYWEPVWEQHSIA